MLLLTGFGVLKADGESLGRVEYKISVVEPALGQPGHASGMVWGKSEWLNAAFDSGTTASIVRDDNGYEMTIVVTSHAPGEAAYVSVSGHPGPLY